jgi:hypothetical protein
MDKRDKKRPERTIKSLMWYLTMNKMMMLPKQYPLTRSKLVEKTTFLQIIPLIKTLISSREQNRISTKSRRSVRSHNMQMDLMETLRLLYLQLPKALISMIKIKVIKR